MYRLLGWPLTSCCKSISSYENCKKVGAFDIFQISVKYKNPNYVLDKVLCELKVHAQIFLIMPWFLIFSSRICLTELKNP